MILGVSKNVTLSPDGSSTSGTLHSVESSPSALFRMPVRVPDQKDWTPDDNSTTCEECQSPFNLVGFYFILSLTLLKYFAEYFALIFPLDRFHDHVIPIHHYSYSITYTGCPTCYLTTLAAAFRALCKRGY